MILFCGDPHGYFEHIIEAVQGFVQRLSFSWATSSRKGRWKSN